MRPDPLTLVGPAYPGHASIVCTSEADALHLCTAAGHIVNVATSEGSHVRCLDPEGLAMFNETRPLLILAGPGDAGERIADALALDLGGATLRLSLPDGRRSIADLRHRGEVLSWLASEWARFGSPWPPGMLERHEAGMTAVEATKYV